jgi:hypothetical protein
VLAIAYVDGVYRHQHGDKLNYVDLSKAIHEPHMKATISLTRIFLRLNPSDKIAPQTELIRELRTMKEHFDAADYTVGIGCIPKIREQGQLVLKAEWERVKRGEPTFLWSQRIALFGLTAAVVLGGILMLQTRSHLNKGAAPAPSPTSATKNMEPTR